MLNAFYYDWCLTSYNVMLDLSEVRRLSEDASDCWQTSVVLLGCREPPTFPTATPRIAVEKVLPVLSLAPVLPLSLLQKLRRPVRAASAGTIFFLRRRTHSHLATTLKVWNIRNIFMLHIYELPPFSCDPRKPPRSCPSFIQGGSDRLRPPHLR